MEEEEFHGLAEEPAASGSSSTFDLSQVTPIYFLLDKKIETALVPKDASSECIKDLFRSATEAGPCDIVKLTTPDGRLLNISSKIPPNQPTSPYRLEVVAVHCNGILMEQVGIDLLALDKRIIALEKVFKPHVSPVENVQELREAVDQLRHKLENYEHLSWLGFHKTLHPPPLSKPAPRSPTSTGPVVGLPGIGYYNKTWEQKQAVCDKFLKLSDVMLTHETCLLLREATFDNWQWEDEEMLVLLQEMYLHLELTKKFDIEINILRNFLMSVYHHYNLVPFHNFRHCFCVTQMMYGMVCKVNLPERVGDLETLILLTACICHDLDHPGYNNIYQINAQTELALRYNDISPLENHHCSTAFRLLEQPESNIFRNLSPGTYKKVREGIIRCILATDMARHNEIVNQFREIIPYFDATNKTHVNLLSMVLIKVADISNEARPMDVAEPWLDCLLAEFFQQSDTEKLEGLPVTPFMDRDKITKPSSQCSFIGLVLLPLFEALASLFTELEPVILDPVRYALGYYRNLNEASSAVRHRKSTPDVNGIPQSIPAGTPPPSRPNNFCDKSPSDPGSMSRTSRENSVTIESRPATRRSSKQRHLSTGSLKGRNSVAGMHSLESDSDREEAVDSEDEEANTEVAVSERALKIKIATDSSFDVSTSRKGSRENKSESISSHSHSVNTNLAKDDTRVSLAMGRSTSSLVRHSSSPEPEAASTLPKVKPKESFFTRLRLFTERLGSVSLDSGTRSDSPPPLAASSKSSQGFHYFRRPKKPDRSREADYASTSTDPSPSQTKSETGTVVAASSLDLNNVAVDVGSASPAPSGTSSGGGANHKASWKQCSGSLDSVLSKDEDQSKCSPSRKLTMLPRFSSFVQKRTNRMGMFIRRSPRHAAPPEPKKEDRHY